MRPKPAPKVALLIETASSYGRGLLRGIARYARLYGPWSFFIEPGGQHEAPPPLRRWGVDGVITLFRSREQARRILAAKLPTVDLDFTLPDQVPAGVCNDEAGVSRLAAEHLRGRGLRHFGFVGWPDSSHWQTAREETFVRLLQAAGGSVDVYDRPGGAGPRDLRHLAAWLQSLPKPAGLLAANDQRARHVLEAARLAELRVPEDLAVLGVDNDETLCELSTPSISSVALNTDHIGFKGAELLDGLLRGRKGPPRPVIVPPLGIIARRSTDMLATADGEVVQAVRFMKENLDKPIRISEVLRDAKVCRKTLEVRFQRALGRTPHEELQRLRLERVKNLLLQTGWPLKKIARSAGFTYVEHLHLIFRRKTGMTPSKFRALHLEV